VIRYFSRETDLPLTLGLMVDTSGSQRRLIGEERTASYRFFDKVLREAKDMAFLIHFDSEVELLQDLTSSRRQLEKSLDQLDSPQMGRSGRGSGGQTPRGGRGVGGTKLYDAVLLASDELMRKQSGRKALIVLSDGVDNGSKVTLARSIEAAQRADTVVYSILFADEDAYGRGSYPGRGGMGRRRGGGMPMPQSRPDGKKILERMSKETGGTLFQVSKKQPLDKIYDRLQEELRNQYSIGYTPEGSAAAGYRKIRLTAKKKGLVVQTRDGYYAD
jgi:VWFA-related protein